MVKILQTLKYGQYPHQSLSTNFGLYQINIDHLIHELYHGYPQIKLKNPCTSIFGVLTLTINFYLDYIRHCLAINFYIIPIPIFN